MLNRHRGHMTRAIFCVAGLMTLTSPNGNRGGTVVKVLCYKSVAGSIPDGVIGIFH